MESRAFFAACIVFLGVVLGATSIAPSHALVNEELHQVAQEGRNQEPAEASDSILQEKRTADYTAALAWWTAGLVAVASLQMLMFGVQLRFMRNGMADTKAAADAAKDSADAARDSFIATYRPRVRVSNVILDPVNRQGVFPEIFVEGHSVNGSFYIFNCGDTPAHITNTHAEVFITHIPLPMRLPYEGQPGDGGRHTLLSGETLITPFRSFRILTARESDDIQGNGNQQIYVMGWVSYEDDVGRGRKTLFCRKYDRMRRRFVPIDDPDYERED